MNSDRPNPDELLARIRDTETQARRGKLKVFFGYAAGVGKTYAMLEAARREKAEGVDIVAGYVEPHNRPETEALLEGLEAVLPRQMPYRGVTLREFDLDAALKRHPQLLLVDELAHTNAEGSRHAKRWQDVLELLDAGIDVYTTLNVQHLESLNDVIAQITGVVVRETLPDSVLERADEIELVDLTPEELIERLQAGKVYISAQAERALDNFFQRSNLVALREMSLRQAAHRLQRDVEAARQARAVQGPWATSERLLICVGPSPTTARLIRTAKRMAASLGADWLAVAVEKRPEGQTPAAPRQRVARHLRLAEQLGAETHVLVGDNVARTILDYARSRNVTKLLVGKTGVPRWRRLLFGTVVDQLLEQSGDIDVYVIRGESEHEAKAPAAVSPPPINWPHYIATALVVALCGLIGWLIHTLNRAAQPIAPGDDHASAEANIVMVFLAGVAFVATRFGRGPAIAASIAGVLTFDFFFVPPYLSFAVSDTQYILTFGIMLVIGLLISTLAVRLREQLLASQTQFFRTAALYRLTKQLSEVTGTEFLVQTAGQKLAELFAGEVVLYLREGHEPVSLRYGEPTSVARTPINAIVAQWVADHDRMAGIGTDTLPNATALFVPLTGSQRTVGALGVRPNVPEQMNDPEQGRLLETCASLIALAIERDQSVLEAHQAQMQVQSEQLRNSLLNSVSHDLRTPLAAIVGAGSTLLNNSPNQDMETHRDLLQSIVDESQRLSRLVDNLLDMTRLEAGAVAPNKQWHVLEELIGSARRRLQKELAGRPFQVTLPDGFPLLYVDGVLVEQVLVNLLENAARYTPPGTKIEIDAKVHGQRAEIRVADAGPGLPPGTEQKVFEKFFRGQLAGADSRRGVGLGLSICRGIVRAHGGEITARNRPTGGAEFIISLPCEKTAPPVPEQGSGTRSQESAEASAASLPIGS
jgi:two-component system sensor histidine kinase KdpD